MAPGRLAQIVRSRGHADPCRHLGQSIGATDVGTVNQVVFFWGFESQADREQRREALEADPDWVSYRKKSADAGNVQHQECKIIKSTRFSPM
jgi:NIPSNAP